MAIIQNDRDVLLQAAAVRFIPPVIDPIRIPGYPGALNNIAQLQDDVEDLEEAIGHLMNTSSSFAIRPSALTFLGASGTTSPSTITLTAVRGSGLVGGTIAWSVFAGSASISPSSGNSTTVTGSTVTGQSVTIRARLTIDEMVHDAYVTLSRFGAVAASDMVSLTTQVTGQLANSNVTGLGALALLNTVNLNTQTVGSLNGQTRVTNLGNLAYVNALAANQVGAGTLAAGVIYAGIINAEQITAGILTGLTIRTGDVYPYVEIDSASNTIQIRNGPGEGTTILSAHYSRFNSQTGNSPAVSVTKSGGNREALSVLGLANHNGIVVGLRAGSTAAPIRMDTSATLPTSRAAGSICFYDGWLCFANGTHWYNSSGVQLT